MAELEREIEAYMGRELRAVGCLWYKFVSPGARGVPDRILCLPGGGVVFIELKTETGQLSALQERQISLLRSRRQAVRVIQGMGEARRFVSYVCRELKGRR